MSPVFSALDYVLFSIVILISIVLCVYFGIKGKRKKTTYEFIFASRKLSLMPVAISMMASGESAIMMMGVPAEVYFYGAQWILAVIGMLFGRILGTLFIVPYIHRLGLSSLNEYIQLRFRSLMLRRAISILTTISWILYMSLVLLGCAMAIETVMAIPYWTTILTLCSVATVCTANGGLKAVVWTDVFQGAMMLMGVVVFIIKGCIDAGGPSYVVEANVQSGRLDLFNFDLDLTVRNTFWGLLIGNFTTAVIYIFTQSDVQRITSIPKVRDAQKSFLLASVSRAFLMSLTVIEGLVIYAYYQRVRCDPMASHKIQNINQIFPHMVVDVFKDTPGLPGLFISIIICASLSTVTSCLGSCGVILCEDLFKPYLKNMSETSQTEWNKVAVVAIGVMTIAVTFILKNVQGSLSQLIRTVPAAIDGTAYGVFVLAWLCPWLNKYGAIGGGIVGMVLLTWITMGTMVASVKISPFMPAAPIDQCFNYVIDSTLGNYTDHSLSNLSMLKTIKEFFNTSTEVISTALSQPPQIKGITWLYSVSYLWLVPFCVVVIFIVGSLISVATGSCKSDVIIQHTLKSRLNSSLPVNENLFTIRKPGALPSRQLMTEEEEGTELIDPQRKC